MEFPAATSSGRNIFQLVAVTKSIALTVKDVRRWVLGFSTGTDWFRSFVELIRNDIDTVLHTKNLPKHSL
jgi:hypothetical protein